jgi:hypothetical protein
MRYVKVDLNLEGQGNSLITHLQALFGKGAQNEFVINLKEFLPESVNEEFFEEFLYPFKNLQTLDIGIFSSFSEFNILKFPKLKNLKLEFASESVIDLSGLPNLKFLEILDLSTDSEDIVTEITIPSLPKLKNLNIGIGLNCLDPLINFDSLNTLTLESCNVSEEFYRYLPHVRRLTMIDNIGNADDEREDSIELQLELLKELNQCLRKFSLFHHQLENGLLHIGTFVNLEEFELVRCGLDVRSLRYLSSLKNLRKLIIRRNYLMDYPTIEQEEAEGVVLSFIRDLPRLENFAFFQDYDELPMPLNLSFLINLPLKELTLETFGISGTYPIETLQNLRKLTISLFDNLSGDMITKIDLRNLIHLEVFTNNSFETRLR